MIKSNIDKLYSAIIIILHESDYLAAIKQFVLIINNETTIEDDVKLYACPSFYV